MSVDRSTVPGSGPPPRLFLPDFETLHLPNGLEIRAARRPRLPEVSLRLVLEAGAGTTPPRQAGLPSLAAALLSEGADDRSAPALADWLGRIGASFTPTVSYDATVLSLHTLSDVLDAALDFLAAVALRPAFDEGEVARVRQERLDEIGRKRDEPAHLAAEVLVRAIYGDHPYGRLARGTPESVAELDGPSLREFHAGQYAARGSVLVACGDVEPGRLASLVEERFGSWSGAVERRPPPAVSVCEGVGGVLLVDRPGSQQSEVRIGGVGAVRGAGDEFDLLVMNAILGGIFNSRLNMNLREDKGWTYGARTAFSLRRGPGPFAARAAVETGVTAPALGEMLRELRRMVSEPPTEEELQLAKNALTLSLPRQFETVGQIAVKETEQVMYGLPDGYWLSYRDRILAVDRAGVLKSAERYLDPARLVTLVVGDADQVAPALEPFGQVRLETLEPLPAGAATSEGTAGPAP